MHYLINIIILNAFWTNNNNKSNIVKPLTNEYVETAEFVLYWEAKVYKYAGIGGWKIVF